ncbi:MAG: NAD(P)/FAD-dependent oxidoreductase [Taibaiella sp.]|nr:NAD(P)/FAD-dependent oxidoreductase [Taibaiella sp.]
MNKKIVILGAGFAGLQLARQLKGTAFDILLIDQYNFHQFQPLFYQVATARLEPSAVSFPLRKVFQRQKNVHIRITKVQTVDTDVRQVITEDGNFAYDYLVIATGCTTNYFGNKNIEEFTFPMKSTNEAITLRNRILLNFEDALSAPPDEQEAIMNIVIAGGGPTGVELAGSLAEMKSNILPRDYPDMDFSKLSIYLVEGMPNTLQNMSEASRTKSRQYLEEMGVHVWVNTFADDYDGHILKLKDGRTIKTRTMIWAAGIKGNLPAGIPGSAVVRGSRIAVDEYNNVNGLSNVFALGDIAYMETPEFPQGHPQVANVAINQAKNLATNIKRLVRNESLKAFRYKSPGSMATVGKHKAVVDLPFLSFQGRLAWFTWMFLHLMLILSVRNKFFIFINWAISYFTNDTTLRLILEPSKKQTTQTAVE